MKNENKALIIITVYVILMLLICLISIMFIRKGPTSYNDSQNETETKCELETQIVYLPIYVENEKETEPVDKTEYFIVRSYEEKIGIFEADGRLREVIEIQIKTLPEADRRQLQEGFRIESEAELRKIIEDYTG